MAKIDIPWNPAEERPLAITATTTGNGLNTKIIMTTSLGRVLIQKDSVDGLWEDITPKMVRETRK